MLYWALVISVLGLLVGLTYSSDKEHPFATIGCLLFGIGLIAVLFGLGFKEGYTKEAKPETTTSGMYLFEGCIRVPKKEVLEVRDDLMKEEWRHFLPADSFSFRYVHYRGAGSLPIVDRTSKIIWVRPNGGDLEMFPVKGDPNGKYWKWDPSKEGVAAGRCSN